MASREGALECSASVWDVPAHGICGVTAQLHGWRLIGASRMGQKGSSVGNRGCSSRWDAGFAANSPKMSCCSNDFHLQVKEKKKSCGKLQDFYPEQILFWVVRSFPGRPTQGRGMRVTVPSSVTPVTQQRSSGLGEPGWVKGGETETPELSCPGTASPAP